MLLRDKLLARIAEMGGARDDRVLAEEVIGIRGASPELARRLVAQALVLEDRQTAWREAGERLCRDAPIGPGVYVLRDEQGAILYVGKANNLRRRLRTHFAGRRWRAIKPLMGRAAQADWIEVGSELEALVREAALIAALAPPVNVQAGPPALTTREVPPALIRDVVVLVPSIETDSIELVAARAAGPVLIQRTRRDGADLAVHGRRLLRFFLSATATFRTSVFGTSPSDFKLQTSNFAALAPLVFSWLAGRGQRATRLDPHDVRTPRELAQRLAALFRDERLFHERLEQC